MCIAGCTPREKQGEEAKKQPDTPSKKTTEPCPLDLQDKLKKCDGGTDILNKAKKANNGKDPVVKVGTPSSGFDAETDTSSGTITISKNSDTCTATESLIFELANMSRKSDFDKVDQDAAAGKLSREEYIKANERIEYENVKDILKATDSCKKAWGCTNHAFDFEGFRGAKDFDDYYKNYLSNSHKDHYGKIWDTSYKK